MASFIVPLNLNKLDLKDYLWHAYRIPVLAVRSFIQQQRVTMDKPGARNPKPRKWFRARAIKRMTVEMADGPGGGPFVWPEEPREFEEWDKETYDLAQKMQEEGQEASQQRPFGTVGRKDHETIASQAKALLSGKEKWRPTWMDYGPAKEVELEFDISRERTR